MTSATKLANIVRRVEREGLGRNAAATLAAVEGHYRRSVEHVVMQEDAHGVDNAQAIAADRLVRRWRDRAIAAGLLSAVACAALEADAIARIDAQVSR